MQYINMYLEDPYIKSLAILMATIPIYLIVRIAFKLVASKVTTRTKTVLDDEIVEALQPAIFWSIFLAGIYQALTTLNFTLLSSEKTINIIYTIAAFIWSLTLGKIVNYSLLEMEQRHKQDDDVKNYVIPLFENISQLIIFLIFLTFVFYIWEINIGPLLAAGGFVGVAIAFAAKDMVANLFGGLSVFFDKPYKVGDYVIINSEHRGEVMDIGMRSTKIRTRDNVLVTVPNAVMVTDAVINETGYDPRLRIRIPIQVTYESDLQHVEDLIVNSLHNSGHVLTTPSPRIRYRKFAESGIELEVLASIEKPAQRGRIIHDLIKIISHDLKEKNIEIPYPKRDIYLYKRD